MRGLGPDGQPKETFPCKVCDQRYSRLEYLRRHERKHNADKPFPCLSCTKSFARSDVLLRHRRRCHPDEFQESEATAAANALVSASNGGSSSTAKGGRRPAKRAAKSPTVAEQEEIDADGHPNKRRRSSRSRSPRDDFSNFDPALNEGFGRSLHEVATRAREADQYDLDGQAGPYYQGPDDVPSHYAYNGSNGPAALPYQQQTDFNLGAFGQNFEPTQSATGDQNLPSLRDSYQFGPDMVQGAWNPGNMSAGPPGPLDQTGRPISFDMQTARPNDGPLSGSDQHGIEHAAALLSMAYQMHKERKPTLEELSPNDNSSDSRLSLHNRAIDPGLQGQNWSSRTALQMRPDVVNISSSSNADLQRTGAFDGREPHDMGSISAFQNSIIPSSMKTLPTSSYKNGTSGQVSVYTGGEWVGPQMPGLMSGLESNEMFWDIPNKFDPNDPYDISAFFPETLDWSDAVAEGEGFPHLPGAALCITPYHENPLIRLETWHKRMQFGEELDTADRFYLPYDRVKRCLEISHWRMPGSRGLADIAKRTISTLIAHVPIIHLDGGFKLASLPPVLSFAASVIGSVRNSPLAGQTQQTANSLNTRAVDLESWKSGASVIDPEAAIEDELTEEEKAFEISKPAVVQDKLRMMQSSFSKITKGESDEVTIAFLQALVMYASPLVLSEFEHARLSGYQQVYKVIHCARSYTKVFESGQPHSRVYSSPLTDSNFLGPGANTHKRWQDWIALETRRRLIWMLYIFDTLGTIETGSEPHLRPSEVSGLPLPVPDTIWQAKSSDAWSLALMGYCPTTLQVALTDHFQSPNGGFMTSTGFESSSHLNSLLLRNDYGSFGRLVMVITLLRGLISLGRGEPDATELLQDWGVNLGACANGKRMVAMVKAYGQALQKWRQGWDFDSLCAASAPSPSASSASFPDRFWNQRHSSTGGTSTASSSQVATPTDTVEPLITRAKGRLMFYEEALPFYWLGQTIYSALAGDPSIITDPDAQAGQRCRNRLAALDMKAMLRSSRVFTRMGEGVPMANF